MRGISFMTFMSIAFVTLVGSAHAEDVPTSKPAEQQQAAPESPPDSSDALRMLGCGDVPPDLSACASDDRKCEVAAKLHGCVNDQRPITKLPRFDRR